MNTQLVLFNYADLDSETRIITQQRANEIKALMKRTAQDIIEIGEKLIEVKERLNHGQFGPWLEAEFGWSWITANKFMNVARQFSNYKNSYNLDMSFETMAYLAAPSTPDEARTEALERAEVGERITHADAERLVEQYKPKPYAPQHTTATSKAPADDNGFEPAEYIPDWLESTAPNEQPDFNYKRDNKTNRESNIYEPKGYDACQTPAYAINPLLPFLNGSKIIWEPAAGEGNLVEAFYDAGFEVIASDILTDQNFFDWQPDSDWHCLITNPPYSIKYKWIEHCYELGKPFALLMPVEMLGAKTAQDLFRQYGIQVILMDKRVNFKMPHKGWDGGGAQFPTAWFTWGLNLDDSLIFVELERESSPQEKTNDTL